ncbi:MAG TPA: hypothetical protein DIC42_06895 [Holosporales bacterium]|nr:hypothetical protein [Holosporales bacterium]
MKTDIVTGASDILLRGIKTGNSILRKIKSNTLLNIIQLEIKHIKYLMIEVLSGYLQNTLSEGDILDTIDTLEKVLYEKYTLDFPETFYPQFPNDDERSLGIDALSYLDRLKWHNDNFVKEDIEKFIDFLKASDALKAHQDLRAYLYKKYPKSKDWI